MPLVRSALASRPARAASSGSAPISGASRPARACSRRARSPCVPRRAWKVTPSSAGRRSASRVRRSRSQKCRASAKRALSTRSLPATTSGAAVGGDDVGDEGEAGGPAAVRMAQREVALVDAHRDLHDLGRQVHEAAVDAAQQRHRPLHQARDLLQQPVIGDQRQPFGGGGCGQPYCDAAAALRRACDDVALGQRRGPSPRRRRRRPGRATGCGGPR